MIQRSITGLLIVLASCSGNPQTPKDDQHDAVHSSQSNNEKSGLSIEFGPNLGASFTDTLGISQFYVHITATITNDSTIPIHLELGMAGEYEFPPFCGASSFKAVLLPKELTPDSATIYNGIVNAEHEFLYRCLDNPGISKYTLQPKEFCVVTIGALIGGSTNCDAVPRAVFSFDDAMLYETCDHLVNQTMSTVPEQELAVKLEYYKQRKFITPEDGCAVIPFGQISYPEGHDKTGSQ